MNEASQPAGCTPPRPERLGEAGEPGTPLLNLYGIPHRKTLTLTQLMQSGPFSLFDTTYLFPVYHCGVGGVNRNRSFEDQNTDWKKVANWVINNSVQAMTGDNRLPFFKNSPLH
jgi:hypothetical protein